MFGFLKKKLKEAAEKITDVIAGKPETIEPKEEPVTKAEPLLEPETPKEEKIEKAEPEPEIKKEVPIEEKPKKKEGFLEKIKKVITEKEVTEKDVSSILEEMKLSLFESDVAVEVAEKITEDLKTALVGKKVPRGKIQKIIDETLEKSLLEILGQDDIDILAMAKEKKPLKIIFLGFNGTGKTTTIARLGHMFKEQGLTPIFAAGDTWRAAAIEQLGIHGEKLGIDVIKHKYKSDPAAVIFDAIKAADSRGLDVVLADTAGRSHANTNLMDEMKKIVRVNKPDLKILVVDCLTGNDAVDQARLFDKAVGIDGIIMTKADVYEKGGAVLSASFAIKKPILYMGIGQDYPDLKKFSAKEVVENLLA